MNFWNQKLKYCLNDLYSNQGESIRQVIVAKETEKVYQYNHCPVMSLKEYIERLPKWKRCLHEVILGSSCQKMKLDVDVEVDVVTRGKNMEIRDDIVRALVKVYKELGYHLSVRKNILMFDSSGKEKSGNEKYSYHIVVNGYYLFSNRFAKYICQRVVEKCKFYGQYIDVGVYKDVQNFRLLGCHKTGSNRVKTFCTEWEYRGRIVETVIPECQMKNLDTFIFTSSLITSTSSCEPMKVEIVSEESREVTEGRDPSLLSIDYYQSIVDDLIGPDIFSASFKRDEVILTRLKPSRCPCCERIHERDHALFKITDKANLIFVCRKGTWVFVERLQDIISDNKPTEDRFEHTSKVERIKDNFGDIESVFS